MSKKSDKNQPGGEEAVIDSRIAAVRDLIFGENIQQYNSEFEEVYQKLDKLREDTERNLSEAVEEIQNSIADLERLMENKLEDLRQDLNKGLDQLDDSKADRRKLGQALEKIAMMLQD